MGTWCHGLIPIPILPPNIIWRCEGTPRKLNGRPIGAPQFGRAPATTHQRLRFASFGSLRARGYEFSSGRLAAGSGGTAFGSAAARWISPASDVGKHRRAAG